MEENALNEQRGLAATQRNWGMDTAANERDQARAWQAYAAEVERQQRVQGNYATLAGYGQNQQNQLEQLGARLRQQYQSAPTAQFGNAQSAGAIGAGQCAGEYVAELWARLERGSQ